MSLELLSPGNPKDVSKDQNFTMQPTTSFDPLPAPIVLIITSIFVQLVSTYEIILNRTIIRVD